MTADSVHGASGAQLVRPSLAYSPADELPTGGAHVVNTPVFSRKTAQVDEDDLSMLHWRYSYILTFMSGGGCIQVPLVPSGMSV